MDLSLLCMIGVYNTRHKGPMTKEEWEKQQSVVRKVFDPDTGRHRYIHRYIVCVYVCVSIIIQYGSVCVVMGFYNICV